MTIENAKTTIINLDDEDNRVILVVFNPRKYADTEHHTAEVYTTYKEYGVVDYQFGVAFDYGNEQEVIDMVLRNYNEGNLAWGELIGD